MIIPPTSALFFAFLISGMRAHTTKKVVKGKKKKYRLGTLPEGTNSFFAYYLRECCRDRHLE